MAAECSSTSLVVTTPAIMMAASLPGSRSRAHANPHGARKRASADGAAVERCRISGRSAGPSDTDRAGLTLSGLPRQLAVRGLALRGLGPEHLPYTGAGGR